MFEDEQQSGSDGDWLVRGSGDPEEVAAYYDRWATGYDDDLDSWSYRAPSVVAGFAMEHSAPQRILDAGCGTGLVGVALRAAGFEGELHGADVSEESLRLAGETNAYTMLTTANLQEPLDFDDDAFGALTCVGVMTYVPAVEDAWREFCRVVEPGGVVVVTQREDFWEPRECPMVIDRLVADGTWEPILVSDAEPYLPGNDDYTDEIGVHYVVARVR
ncbi:MAG: class I SAM-dependent methyltransferase [Ilumatobacter sp.]|uniref:class I SAM-dependent DNA methyltransferase n=1 Tax=Ilumatobacter sp. TaxID=1967498 RepID=UPI002619758C|nr:class I SAM-dependent methyltransferase [Ilumatobacter sp.]MDJ0768229.1 class I SAM-dependent methyltransferase [Ilumatobacter sp.]